MEAQETRTGSGAMIGTEVQPTASRSVFEQELAIIWQKLLSIDSILPDQNYFDLGGDSSLAVQMFAQIEKRFNVKLPLACLYDAPTIEELAKVLQSELSENRWSPLVSIQPQGPRSPFFCMHGAGGNVLNYRELSQHMGPDQPFYGLQCLGLDGSCAPLTRIEDMAAIYIKEIRRVQPQGPYLLGGYCMGGTVAYEVAQQLAAQSEDVALLALFDTMNWHLVPLNFWTRSSHTAQQWRFHIASFLSPDFSGKRKFLREKLTVLRARIPVWWGMFLARFGKEPDHAQSEALLLAKIWRTNDRACWNYVPQPFPGRILDIRPKKQYRAFSDENLKWDRLAQKGQKTVVLPVYPAAMLVEPFVQHLAVALRQAIDEAMPVSTR